MKKFTVLMLVLLSSFLLNVCADKNGAWSQSQITDALESSMNFFSAYFTKMVPACEVIYEDDVIFICSYLPDEDLYCYSNVLSAQFNSKNVAQRVQEVMQIYQERNLSFSWWVGPNSTPANLEEILKQSNFTLCRSYSGMYRSVHGLEVEKLQALQIKSISEASMLWDFNNVLMQAGGSLQVYERMLRVLPENVYSTGAPVELYVGYIDGNPVTIGAVAFYANVGYIDWVTTIPKERNKGYGSAIMYYLINRTAERNYSLVVLLATKEAINLYKRMGFQEYCTYKEYYFCNGLTS